MWKVSILSWNKGYHNIYILKVYSFNEFWIGWWLYGVLFCFNFDGAMEIDFYHIEHIMEGNWKFENGGKDFLQVLIKELTRRSIMGKGEAICSKAFMEKGIVMSKVQGKATNEAGGMWVIMYFHAIKSMDRRSYR